MSKILANVGGMPITEDDVNEFLAGLGPRGQSYNNPEGRKAVLGQLINNKLLLQDARRNLYEADPAFKAELAKLKDNLLVSFAADKAIASCSVSDADVTAYYEANSDKFMQGETVNASHILVDTEEAALEILGKIKAGEVSFEDAAKEYSSCPSKENGGNLGDFGRGQMVPEFDSACFEMAVGEIRGPVKTQFGFHLIKLNAKNEAKPIEFSEIADQIKQKLMSDKQQAAYRSKINQLKILFPVDIL